MRKATNELIDMAESGAIDWETIARECLSYMPESEVLDMATSCDWISDEDEDEDEDEDA